MRSLVLLFSVLFFFSSCDELPFLSAGSGTNDAMKLKVTADNIEVMQHIEADFTFTNVTNKRVEYGFPSSCQHGFKVKNGDKVLFNSQYEYGCLAVLTSFELAPGESKTFKIDLSNGGDYEYLESGTYTLEAFLLNEDSDTVSTNFEVE
ncbi:MAG: BsuPI-related putative proteinase inhibitor [Gracilimonas sp.]|uniref:BsuPI-related putative proteinase inhibitor n=1 Tax=Gracilimonas sp. TaxID=1974203 RepID=UPI003753AF3D|nr:BsuPI-related putative proteinase inhibitor [Gracilimonas sp.]